MHDDDGLLVGGCNGLDEVVAVVPRVQVVLVAFVVFDGYIPGCVSCVFGLGKRAYTHPSPESEEMKTMAVSAAAAASAPAVASSVVLVMISVALLDFLFLMPSRGAIRYCICVRLDSNDL